MSSIDDDDFIPSVSSRRRGAFGRVERGRGVEATRVINRLSGFNREISDAWIEIKSRFGPGITHNELKSVAIIVCERTGEKLDRDATRDSRVLVKWFDERWNKIESVVKKIHLHDNNDEIINAEREESLNKHE